MALALPPRENLSASKSMPSNLAASPPAFTATTNRPAIGAPLDELLDDEELLEDDELLDEDELLDDDAFPEDELLEDELLDEELLEDDEPLADCPPQPHSTKAVSVQANRLALMPR